MFRVFHCWSKKKIRIPAPLGNLLKVNFSRGSQPVHALASGNAHSFTSMVGANLEVIAGRVIADAADLCGGAKLAAAPIKSAA